MRPPGHVRRQRDDEFNLLEPRTFRYMTKADVLDGRREAAARRIGS